MPVPRNPPTAGERRRGGLAIASGQAVATPDIVQDPCRERLREPLLARGIRTSLAVPLITASRVLGAAVLGSPTSREFPREETLFLQSRANQLGVALEQARLREEAAEGWRLEVVSR